ncbi:hypothetical protein BpHYR1_054489 [Brachionus plicatilis]|uniref:Uncharacterized protein n=1 Tax=Brachionus plicatilis TaxID=10195 RepID=A0A3M7S7Y7_BRAPC|nr:hypothetical protein BpHYR1_054489 [Brachionus plicatilis]
MPTFSGLTGDGSSSKSSVLLVLDDSSSWNSSCVLFKSHDSFNGLTGLNGFELGSEASSIKLRGIYVLSIISVEINK